jgi:alkylated DNA repair dioxygenase AlkB
MDLVNDADGSRIVLFKKWLPDLECKTYFEYCTTLKTKLYPFNLKQKRLLWACGDSGVYHEFRNVQVDIHEWSTECLAIRDKINSEFDVYNNFCLINHYRDGRDSIAPHSDGELYSKNKSVFTVSVGETRQMKLVPYSSAKGTIVFDFEAGDLLWMCGNVQSKWKHGIDVDPSIIHPRYSFTLRSTLLSKKRKQVEETQTETETVI